MSSDSSFGSCPGLNMEAYGGVNPLAFGEEYALLDLRLSGVPSFTLKGTTVPIPSQNPEQSLQLLLAAGKISRW